MTSSNGRTPSDRKGFDKRVSTSRPPPPLGARPLSSTGTSGRRRAAERQRLRNLLLVGSGVLVAIIVVAELLFARPSGGIAAGLTDPNALNPSPSMLAVGSKAPDFSLATADGQHVSLSSLSGHPVVLEFFAVWCPHCQNEATALNQIEQKFAGAGEKTVAILANPFGKDYETSNGNDHRLADKSDLSWFDSTFGVKHPTLVDPSFGVVNQYGASSYPTIYIVDGSGTIRFAQAGEVPYQDLANVLNQLH